MNKKRVMGKSFVFLLIGLFALMFVSSVVSAGVGDEIRRGVGEISNAVSGIFQDLGLGSEGLSTLFFAIIIGLIVFNVVESIFPDSKGYIKWGISLAITGVSIIGIPSELLLSLQNSYGAMGAAILFIIPFLVVLVFTIKIDNLFLARVTWIAFIGYYFLLYAQGISFKGTFFTNYWDLLGIVLGGITFFALEPIRDFVFKNKIESLKEGGMQDIKFRALGRELEREETKSRTSN